MNNIVPNKILLFKNNIYNIGIFCMISFTITTGITFYINNKLNKIINYNNEMINII